MSVVRAFTTRRRHPDVELRSPATLGRAASQRNGRPVQRSQISSPVALVSTTNMLSYNAPNIAGTTPVEYREPNSTSPSSSSEESDSSTVHSRDTATDMSSVEASPIATEPEPNHLSHFFKQAGPDLTTPSRSASTQGRPSMDAPNLPRRAPSHSKRAHEAVSRQRSVQRAKSPPANGHDLGRSSVDLFNPASPAFVEAPRENPFGKELAQLDEVVEEFGSTVRSAEADSDAAYLAMRGLARCSASDYLSEIRGLIGVLLSDDRSPTVPDFSGWF